MSVISIDQPPGAGAHAAKRDSVWQRVAHALDAYLVDRSRRAMPAATLRRSKHDIDRCRRLMHRGSAMATAASLGSRGFART